MGRRDGRGGRNRSNRRNSSRWKGALPFFAAAGAFFLIWFVWFSWGMYRQRQDTEARILEQENGRAVEAIGSPAKNVLEYNGKKIQAEYGNARNPLPWR